jgi:rare lipoprotein A
VRAGAVLSYGLVLLLGGSAGSEARLSSSPRVKKNKVQEGVASWYGPGFHGKVTASGEVYDMHALTAAHRTLPLGALIEVRNLDNGRTLVARVNDRGPHVRGRILDLSKGAAEILGLDRTGTARVRVTVVKQPDLSYWIQVGSFRQEKNARALRNALERQYPSAVVRVDAEWYRVQIPAGVKRRAAEALRRDLRREGFKTFLIQRPADSKPL